MGRFVARGLGPSMPGIVGGWLYPNRMQGRRLAVLSRRVGSLVSTKLLGCTTTHISIASRSRRNCRHYMVQEKLVAISSRHAISEYQKVVNMQIHRSELRDDTRHLREPVRTQGRRSRSTKKSRLNQRTVRIKYIRDYEGNGNQTLCNFLSFHR